MLKSVFLLQMLYKTSVDEVFMHHFEKMSSASGGFRPLIAHPWKKSWGGHDSALNISTLDISHEHSVLKIHFPDDSPSLFAFRQLAGLLETHFYTANTLRCSAVAVWKTERDRCANCDPSSL